MTLQINDRKNSKTFSRKQGLRMQKNRGKKVEKVDLALSDLPVTYNIVFSDHHQ